jgi:hypothetical protein
LCVITLANGKGRCGLTAKKLPIGSYAAKASYTGGTTYARSATAKNLTVVKLSASGPDRCSFQRRVSAIPG